MNGPSLDTVLARDCGAETFRDVLRLTVSNATGSNRAHFNFTEDGSFIRPQANPLSAFEFLFGGSTGATDPSSPDPAPCLAALWGARRSMLDPVAEDARWLQARLPSAQRPKMEQTLDAIRAQERVFQQRLDESTGAGGPPAPSCDDPSAPADGGTFIERTRRHMDVIANGFGCDLTRFATLMMAPGADSSNLRSFVPELMSMSYHDASHRWEESAIQQALVEVNRYFAAQVAYLVERLAAIPEGDGSVLDRTLILWTNECWHGNHDPFRLPLVVAGGRALGLGTGRVYTPPDGEGRQYGKLLVSLANAVGHPMTEFGDPRWSSGPLPGLFG
jgi:hypothetical protein